MIILGIETSCDETSVGIVKDGTNVLANCISSSKEDFSMLGGVVPEEAARSQIEYMLPVLHAALDKSKQSMENIHAIAVTKGPGLLGSLLVGVVAARTLAAIWKKPLIGVPHTLGHLSSVWLGTTNKPQFPSITLSVSGGHTDLWLRKSHCENTLLGQTRDDAAGEAFDKGASMLGLTYPGGPAISLAGKTGNTEAALFPRPLHNEEGYDFSFSGLKTSLKYALREKKHPLNKNDLKDISASYEYALCRHLCEKVNKAATDFPDIEEFHIVGGVSANIRLRSMLQAILPKHRILFPEKIEYCTDNGAMIASAGFFLYNENKIEACKIFAVMS